MSESSTVQRGDRFARKGEARTVRVMAIADGWAIVRYPRAVPFAVFVKDLLDVAQWERVEAMK